MGLLVVLVRTHSPGNLGSAARAARNFGASLTLLDPRADRWHPDALAFASGAVDLLRQAPVMKVWDELLEAADRTVALTSLRGRAARGLPPRTTWPRIRAEAAGRTVALLFGPERGGLTTEELSRCDARLSLPADPVFPTLNLAQAVAASLALGQPVRGRAAVSPGGLAPARQIARLLDRLHRLLALAGFPGKGRSQAVLAEIDALLRRARPTERDVTLLLGALAALERVSVRRRERRPPSPVR